ncbi:MAG TPA: ABC transporter ATP-binding protein [Methanocella sp.]|uniref:ABC transporter ATP-binding protein n=1 Tax=Methanocella sp. TaxID=2052833 RepID=UPI002BD33473|nr:ABC transporter ATP-binding protein [Methanocella sp.]HTY91986.1 ABC transporter ATP-binding protein [Methanocella sp.]
MTEGIRIAGIGKAYGGLKVLEGIDVSIEKGSVVALLGPNGCGKTTLLKIISRYLVPDHGNVFLEGKNVAEMRPVELSKKMGSVPQSHRSSFPFAVIDVVLTGRAPYVGAFSTPSKADLEVVTCVLSTLGIAHLADMPYTAISGGERQLVMIARALAQEPEFLLLDEPTTFLDLKNQMRVLALVTGLAREEGMTVVMTLHDPNHALIYSDDVVLLAKLDGGRSNVVARGRALDVMTAENIQAVYGVDVQIIEHENKKIILPYIK